MMKNKERKLLFRPRRHGGLCSEGRLPWWRWTHPPGLAPGTQLLTPPVQECPWHCPCGCGGAAGNFPMSRLGPYASTTPEPLTELRFVSFRDQGEGHSDFFFFFFGGSGSAVTVVVWCLSLYFSLLVRGCHLCLPTSSHTPLSRSPRGSAPCTSALLGSH